MYVSKYFFGIKQIQNEKYLKTTIKNKIYLQSLIPLWEEKGKNLYLFLLFSISEIEMG